MPSVLTVITVTKRNRASWAHDLLINGSRVAFFHKDPQYPTTQSVLHYRIFPFERGKTWELQVSETTNAIATKLMEDETNAVIKVDVDNYKWEGWAREKPTDSATLPYELVADNVVYAYNVGTGCYCWVDCGLNLIRLKLSHTIEDLSRAFSTSASLSAS